MSNSRLNERLFMDTVHPDVVFVVENEEIPGHQAAFAASCPYFEKLLYGDFKESKLDKVRITETSAKAFKEIKRFIYLGNLDIAHWKIEDQLELLAVAHEYQYDELFAVVMKHLEKQPLNFDTWTLVNSAATIYDSASLKAKCVSFAEAEVDNFLCLKNVERMTEELICCMFDSPKISTVNQDQLLSGLLQWKKTHCSAQIRSVLQKICWNEVSHNTTAVVAQLLLQHLKNEDEMTFCNQLIANTKVQSQCIAKLGDVSLMVGKTVKFAMEKDGSFIYCYNGSEYIQFYFKQNDLLKEIPVTRIEFELSNQNRIQEVGGSGIHSPFKKMDYKITTASNDWMQYSATFSEAEPVYDIRIYSDNFTKTSEITLRRLVVY